LANIILETQSKPQLIEVILRSEVPCILRMIGSDNNVNNAIYFNRGAGVTNNKFEGTRTFLFPLPLTPRRLLFRAFCNDKNHEIEIVDVEFKKLNQDQLWLRPHDKNFLMFALRFALESSYISTGVYEEEFTVVENGIESKGSFNIIYNQSIKNAKGEDESTPARISRATGVIEINRSKFLAYSIPMRLIILLHEYMHWRLSTRVELEADYNALNIFLKLGFSKTEALYAYTKIFVDEPDRLGDRVQSLFDFIEAFPNLN
jgi:hypothetical protein